MTSLLTSHLEQISLCAASIAELPFHGPKIFTNALLDPHHDITQLIRDTEAHERALFHLAPPAISTKASDYMSSVITGTSQAERQRRATGYVGRQGPKNKAVAAVLGRNLYQKTRREGFQKGEIDVEVLLEGAERLAAVYPIPGVSEKISALRRRHEQLIANIAHYEDRVARNAQELQLMNRPLGYGDNDERLDEAEQQDTAALPITKEDLRKEEEEIRELERKKQNLEERVNGMSRDLGGLMR